MAPPQIDEALLDAKLADLERARDWSPRLVSKLEALVRGDERELFRVNALTFAEERGIDPSESLDLFLHATHLGLYYMTWNIVCPICGQTAQSFASLRVVAAHYFCGLCQLGADAQLDDLIQVGFTLSPAVRRLAMHEPETMDPLDYFADYRFSREARVASGERMGDAVRALSRACVRLEPGKVTRVALEAERPKLHGTDGENDAGLVLEVEGAPSDTPQSAQVRYDGSRFEPSHLALRPGAVTLDVEHTGSDPGTFILIQIPADGPADEPLTTLDPFVTGSMLLANQTFRRLFRSEVIPAHEGIGVRDVTLLFTDLTGSTALYERIGDLQAFSLVRQHFDHIEQVVQANGGAVVKTIGDAVMAVFLESAGAVRAGLEILEAIDQFNAKHGNRDLILKIGLHRGPSIAVTLNENLDYFGQTVNVAARVQGLAGPNEVWITEDVYGSPGVAGLLDRTDVSSQDVQLKGIDKAVRVYRAARRAAAA